MPTLHSRSTSACGIEGWRTGEMSSIPSLRSHPPMPYPHHSPTLPLSTIRSRSPPLLAPPSRSYPSPSYPILLPNSPPMPSLLRPPTLQASNHPSLPPIGIAEWLACVRGRYPPILLHLFLHPLQAPTYEPIRPPTPIAPNSRSTSACGIEGRYAGRRYPHFVTSNSHPLLSTSTLSPPTTNPPSLQPKHSSAYRHRGEASAGSRIDALHSVTPNFHPPPTPLQSTSTCGIKW